MRALLFLLALWCGTVAAQPVPSPVLYAKASAPSNTLSISCPGTGSTSSTVACTGTYGGTAPTSISTATWQTTCSGSSTITSFTASGGTLSFTASTPSSACAGALRVTDNRSVTANSGTVTISGAAYWTLVSHATAAGSISGGTTNGVSTTGATIIVVEVSWYCAAGGSTTVSVSDNQSNTYTSLTKAGGGTNVCTQLWYKLNPTTAASGHTFTLSAGGGLYGTIQAATFSGSATPGYDTSSQGEAFTNSVNPGSVTPANNNSLVVTGFGGAYQNGVASVSTPYSITDQEPNVNGVTEAGALAWQSLASPSAQNPTWTTTGSLGVADTVASIAVFHP